jgi:glycosyltransferase involved in cell wall biosynthesis
MTKARILIAMPLFEGLEHVEHTLLSVQAQTFRDYRVLISVDGADKRSYEACKRFSDDPRFEIVVHERRLHWNGNINWLASQLREDYFCYWQHDDHCAPDYLQVLIDYADRHPEAASVYCDMQHFGTRNDVVRHKSVVGFALERVLEQARRANPAAIRCLVRRAAMVSALPITSATTWTVAVARAGELHRIPRILYFRRNRPDSLGMQMLTMPEEEMLAFTLEYGLGVFKYAYPLVQKEEIGRLLGMIADQLVNAQIRKRWQVDFASAAPQLREKFLARFFETAVREFGVSPAAVQEGRERLALISSEAQRATRDGGVKVRPGFWSKAIAALSHPTKSSRRRRG